MIDDLPLKNYLETKAGDWLDGLLKPEPTGGAGAANQSAPGKVKAGAFDSDKIQPGMKAEDRAAAWTALRQVAAQSGQKL